MNARTHWWKNAKLYELYVDAFAGTFARLADHLPYFTQLGVNCLHILPHFPSPMQISEYLPSLIHVMDTYTALTRSDSWFQDCAAIPPSVGPPRRPSIPSHISNAAKAATTMPITTRLSSHYYAGIPTAMELRSATVRRLD